MKRMKISRTEIKSCVRREWGANKMPKTMTKRKNGWRNRKWLNNNKAHENASPTWISVSVCVCDWLCIKWSSRKQTHYLSRADAVVFLLFCAFSSLSCSLACEPYQWLANATWYCYAFGKMLCNCSFYAYFSIPSVLLLYTHTVLLRTLSICCSFTRCVFHRI